jgi:hypothetical protein
VLELQFLRAAKVQQVPEDQEQVGFQRKAQTSFEEGTGTAQSNIQNCPLSTRYIKIGGGSGRGFVFDLATDSYISQFLSGTANNTALSAHYPLQTNHIPCKYDQPTSISTRSAFTARTLTTPLTKTSANGMTATYELEVYW